MLSTFFSTSRPIQYLMVLIMVTVAVLSSLLWNVDIVWWELIAILILPASLAVFEFIVSKNILTPASSYALWTASSLSLLYLVFDVQLNLLFALFFILLSVRRLLSLKSGISTIKKIFDATMWITVATIFYHWSVLFYLIVFVAIFLFVRNDYRHWITPFIAIGCAWVLLFTYDYVLEYQLLFDLWNTYKVDYIWEQESFMGKPMILLILLVTSIIGLLIYISKIIDFQQVVRPRFTVITFTGICAIIIAILDFDSFAQGGFLLLIPGLSVFIAGFAHTVTHKIISELSLWFPVLLLVISFLLY